jgi:hypothetical protein
MELEEMKTLWEAMSQKVEKQQTMTDKLILEMTKARYKNRFTKITMFETMGTIICFAMAFIVILNFQKLDTWYLATSGIFAIAFLVAMPILVLQLWSKMRNLNLGGGNFKDVLNQYANYKASMLRMQRVSIYLNFPFLLIVFLLSNKIMNNRDFIQEGIGWFWMIPALIFLYFFSRWGYGQYVKITNSAEEILKELEE